MHWTMSRYVFDAVKKLVRFDFERDSFVSIDLQRKIVQSRANEFEYTIMFFR